MRPIAPALSTFLLCYLSASLAFAGTTSHLEEMVVSAARSKSTLFDLAHSATVLDQQFLNRTQPRTLPEALTGLPGVVVQKTANGQGSPFLRGFTGYRTLTLIDGVRYNNSVYRDGPNEYFSLIDSQSINSIEVLSGPSSSLYGSDAIGGTLNIRTASALKKHGERYLEGQQNYRYSSAETSHISHTRLAAGAPGEWGMIIGASWKEFGEVDAADIGKQEKTGYDERAANLRIDRQLNERWGVSLLHQTLNQNNVWRTHSTIYGSSFSGSAIGTDLRRLKDQQRSLSYFKFSGNNLSGPVSSLQLTLSHQRWDENGNRIKANGKRLRDYFDSRMSGIDLGLRSELSHVTLSYGLDYYQDQVESGRRDYNADGSLEQIRIQGPVGDDSKLELYGAYIQGEWWVSDSFTLTLGSRYTQSRAHIGRYEDPATQSPASFSDHWTSNVSSVRASYALSEQWRLWGGVSQSFRAPNLADLSRYGKSRSSETEVAATHLSPEYFLTFETGVKQQTSVQQFTASVYYTDIKDFISSTPTGRVIEGLTEVSKQNSSNGYIQGIELSLNRALANQLELSANLTWLNGELEANSATTTTTDTEPFSRITPLTARAALQWNSTASHWGRLELLYAAKADKLSSGDRADTERIPPGGTPSYSLLHLRVGVSVNKQLSLTIGLENLLDEAYRSHGSGSNEPGRGITFGLSANF